LETLDGFLKQDGVVVEGLWPPGSESLVVTDDSWVSFEAYEPSLVGLLQDVCMVLRKSMCGVMLLVLERG